MRPDGVFAFTKERGEDRFIWQPQAAVRIAAILVRYEGQRPGFVLAGRSLGDVERREDQLEVLVGVAWAAVLAATLLVVIVVSLFDDHRAGSAAR